MQETVLFIFFPSKSHMGAWKKGRSWKAMAWYERLLGRTWKDIQKVMLNNYFNYYEGVLNLKLLLLLPFFKYLMEIPKWVFEAQIKTFV